MIRLSTPNFERAKAATKRPAERLEKSQYPFYGGGPRSSHGHVDGTSRKISKLQATAMQLATQAAGGNQAAIAKFLDWIDEIEKRSAAAKPTEFPFSEADLQVLCSL